MRALIAPDSFGNTLTAVQAADAIARGWSSERPVDIVTIVPQSDGGPGFVDVLSSVFGQVRTANVCGPLDGEVPATWLLHGTTAYIESASACGLALLTAPADSHSALAGTSFGVGQLIAHAIDAGCTTVVVGLGGSATNDGGRGLVRALGGINQAREALAHIDVVVATDVENPLLGPDGAIAVFAPQKGADGAARAELEARNEMWAAQIRDLTGFDAGAIAGGGAAGGIGAALLALGGRRVSGAEMVAQALGLADCIREADVVITGEGKFDSQSLRGKVVTAVAALAMTHNTRTIVLAGQVALSASEIERAGVAAAYSLVELTSSVELAMRDAENQLEKLASWTASRWSDM